MLSTKKRNESLRNEFVKKLLVRISASTRRMNEGKTTYIIGNNGTGKSRILSELAEQLADSQPTRTVACISNSIYDRFKFSDSSRIRYLGARNASNAVFHSATDRQLARFILRAMQHDRRLLSQLSEAVEMEFSFTLRENVLDQVSDRLDLSSKRRTKSKSHRDLLTTRYLRMLKRISNSDGRFSKLTKAQIPALLRYLELNIDIDLYVTISDGSKINFGSLSTGEQNRTLLFAKVLSAMEEGTVFLIDEPEISLHLHWQMSFHRTLMQLLSKLKRFHVVIATHAPIIISEAAKQNPYSQQNLVGILYRKSANEKFSEKNNLDKSLAHYKFHTFADVSSHEQLVLRYFKTAPYHAHEVSIEIADAILSVSEGTSNTNTALSILHELQSTVGLSEEARVQINSALCLIEKDLVIFQHRKNLT